MPVGRPGSGSRKKPKPKPIVLFGKPKPEPSPKPKKPPPGPKHTYAPAPRKTPDVPPSQPISERAMASKNRTQRQAASRARTRGTSRDARIWAATHANWIPPGLHDKLSKGRPLTKGEQFAVRVALGPLTKEGQRVLATRGQRAKLASARSAKRQIGAMLADVRPLGAQHLAVVMPYHRGVHRQPRTRTEAGDYAARRYLESIAGEEAAKTAGARSLRAGVSSAQIYPESTIKPARTKLTEREKVLNAALTPSSLTMGGVFTNIPTDLAKAAIYAVPGAIWAAQHPWAAAKSLPGQIVEDFRQVGEGHLAFAGLDIAGLAAGGAGIGARAVAGSRALALARAGVPKGLPSRVMTGAYPEAGRAGVLSSFLKRPLSPARTLGGAYVPASENAFARWMINQFGKKGHPARTHSENQAIAMSQRMERHLADGAAVALAHLDLNDGEQLALHAVEMQVHPRSMVRLFQEQMGTARNAVERRRFKRARDAWKEAEQYVKVHAKAVPSPKRARVAALATRSPFTGEREVARGMLGNELEVKPHLQEAYKLLREVSDRGEQFMRDNTSMSEDALRARIDGPREVVARMIGGHNMEPLGVPRGYVSHVAETELKAAVSKRFGKMVAAFYRKPGSMRKTDYWNLIMGRVPTETTRIVSRTALEKGRIEHWVSTQEKIHRSGIDPTDPRIARAVAGGRLWDHWVGVRKVRTLTPEAKAALRNLAPDDPQHNFLNELFERNIGEKPSDFRDILGNEELADNLTLLKAAGVKFVPKSRVKVLREGIHPRSEVGVYADAVNRAIVGAMILMPKYLAVNLPGQVWLTGKNGAINPVNVRASVKIWHQLKADHPADFWAARRALGGGAAHSLIREGGGGELIPGMDRLRLRYGKIIDDPFRWTSFVHHARRRGYTSADSIADLIRGVERKAGDRETVFHSANRDLIDYERMGDLEKNFVRRALLFYPWLKGSSMYAGRYLREHPIQARAELGLGQQGREEQMRRLGPVPSWAQGLVPVGGDMDIPGVGRVPGVLDVTSASILGQPAELIQDIEAEINFLRSRGKPTVGQYIAPVFTAPIGAFTGINLSRGEPIPEGANPLETIARSFISPYRTLREAMDAPNPNALYPRTLRQSLERNILFGGLRREPVQRPTLTRYAEEEARSRLSKKERERQGKKWSSKRGGAKKWGSSRSGTKKWGE